MPIVGSMIEANQGIPGHAGDERATAKDVIQVPMEGSFKGAHQQDNAHDDIAVEDREGGMTNGIDPSKTKGLCYFELFVWVVALN
jgi:hypothetical protein